MLKIKFILSILYFFLLTAYASSQSKLDAQVEFDKIKSESNDFGANAVKYLKNNKEELPFGLTDKIVAEAARIESKEFREICCLIGAYYFHRNMMERAYKFLCTAQKYDSGPPISTQHYAGDFHKYLGYVFAYFERKDEAFYHLRKSLTYENLEPVSRIRVHNSLGLMYSNRNDHVKAKKEFWKAYDLAIESGHQEWVGVLYGNLGLLAFKKGDYITAKRLSLLDYQLSKENGEKDSQINAFIILSEMELLENGTSNLEPNIRELDSLIVTGVMPTTRRNYYRFLRNYYEKKGDFKAALDSYKSFQLVSDSLDADKDLISISKFEFQIDFEKKQSELKLLGERRKRDQALFYAIISGLTVLVVGAIIIVWLQSKRRQQERKLLTIQKSVIKEELLNSEKELELMVSKLTEKSSLVDDLKDKLDAINLDKDLAGIVDRLESFTILTEEHWTNFKKIFNKLNPGFFVFLQKEHPELTPAETRFITLIRLNLSKSEIANALGISPESVRKTSLRLRKKMNIDSHEELVQFILELRS